MKRAINRLIDWVCFLVLYPPVVVFDRYCLHRLQAVRGRGVLSRVKARGENVVLHGYSKVMAPERLSIGSHVRIGTGCCFNCLGGVTIGANSQLSRGVVIYSANHDYHGSTLPYDNSYVTKPVVIGKSVWVGMGVCILPGVTIGDGAIIGMGTVVSQDVPPCAIVVGGPQRVVKFRDRERFARLNADEMWFGKIFPEE